MLAPLLLALLAATAPTGSDTWPGFRADGSSRTDARDLPLTWSPTENIAWRVETPGYGQSAPVVWKGRVYLTAVEGAEKETLHVLCYAAADGRVLWRRTFPAAQKGRNNPMTSRAAPTAVADAAGVYAFFESGDLFALTRDGRLRWERHLAREVGELKNNHGLASSPAQTERAVLVLVDHQGPSFLLAVDKADGATAWKADRTPRASWTSPVVATVGGEPVVVVSSGGAVTGYDGYSGKRLWELDGLSGNTMPSATVLGDRVVVGAAESARKPDAAGTARSNCCLRLTAGGPGYEVVWRGTRVAAGTASPLAHAGHVYLVDKGGVVQCLDLMTGGLRYRERLPSPVWATPVGAGDRVYFFGKDGETTVLKTGPEFDVVATNRVWSEADFARRREEAKLKAADTLPKPPEGKGPGGGPPLPKEEAEAVRYAAVGDVVYGVAAVDGAFFVRTGTELFCIRSRR
jgi:outer membrane protein assembly factor BamB